MANNYDNLQNFYKSKALGAIGGAVAGWLYSDRLVTAPRGSMTPEQKREWDRTVDRAMQQRKDKKSSMNLRKDHAPIPPQQGLVWDAVKHRWTNPKNIGHSVTDVKGRKRRRGTGTGAHEHQLAQGRAGGKGRGASAEAGRRFRGAADTGQLTPHTSNHPSTKHQLGHIKHPKGHAKKSRSALKRFMRKEIAKAFNDIQAFYKKI